MSKAILFSGAVVMVVIGLYGNLESYVGGGVVLMWIGLALK